MDLKYVMDFMNRIWVIVSMISIGIIIGMVFLPETIETGIQFLLLVL